MIILILFVSVFCISPTTYRLTQNVNLNYEIEINNHPFIIDLINEFSVSDEKGTPQTCNQYYQCQYCNSQCIYTFYDVNDQIQNGTLQEQIIKINNYQNQEQIEELTTVYSESSYLLGLGVRRNQNYSNFTFPYNPFLSDITSICFANIGFLHKGTQFENNSIKLKYEIMGNQYGVQFQGIQISRNTYLKITSYPVQFDSLNPYTKIPADLFTSLLAYYKTLGFSFINKGFISIHKGKFNLNLIEPIRFYINETFYLEYEPKQFLYYQGDYISLAFKRTDQLNIIQGTAFLTNLYMTINQNEQSMILSQLDCEREINPPIDLHYYIIMIVLISIIIFVCIYSIWKKKETYIKVTSGKGTEVELQNQNSAIEKEDDESQI